jgi:hypothetical protein
MDVDKKFLKRTTVDGLPKIPLRDIEVNGNFKNIHLLLDFLEHYKESVTRLTLFRMIAAPLKDFKIIVKALPNLQKFTMDDCAFYLKTNGVGKFCHPPQLKKLNLHNIRGADDFFKMFHGCRTLETVKYVPGIPHPDYGTIDMELKKFLQSLPKLRKLTFSPYGPTDILARVVFPELKLESLKIKNLDFMPKAGTLKELKFSSFPCDESRFQECDGRDIVKHVFEELQLERLYHYKTPLILNHQPQPCCLTLSEDQIEVALMLVKYLSKFWSFLLKISMPKKINIKKFQY